MDDECLREIRDELRMIRQLMDKNGKFNQFDSSAVPAPKPNEIINFDPDRIKWTKQMSRAGKGEFEVYPANKTDKIEATAEYKALVEAIKNAKPNKRGQRFYNQGLWHYWLGPDGATVFRRKNGGKEATKSG
jgi:hypothetical protein